MATGNEKGTARSGRAKGAGPSVPVGKSKKPAKKPASKPAAKPSSGGGYDWGDGRNVHSIPVEQHNANRGGVATYGVTPDTPLDAPLTSAQGYAMAQAAANRTFAPQLQANAQLQSNTPAWYQNYIARTGEAQKAAQTYAQPTLDTAQAAVGNAAQTAPGLDPSSPQYAKEQQAAQGRQTMAQDSANYLAGVAAATNAYFGGQANIAQRELPQVQAGLVYQGGQLASQRQDAATAAYGDIRSNEQNASIARQTLGLNTAKAASDVAYDQATLDQKTQDKADKTKAEGQKVNSYGYTNEQWQRFSAGHRARIIADSKKSGTTGKDTKDAEKKKAAIQASTGKVKVDVGKVIAKWDSYKGQQTDDTSKPKDPKTGEYPARNLTPSDIKRILGEKYDPQLIHVALLVRTGKALDQAAIDYLHSKDPNIRIPREWLKGKQKSSGVAPVKSTHGTKQDPYGSGPGHH